MPGEHTAPPLGSVSIPTSLRVGIAEPLSIDPARVDSSSGLLVIAQAFDGLVTTDPSSGEPKPAVAKSWHVLEGGSVIEFTLREDVTFHDGLPVRAADFVFAWNRLADPVMHAPYAFLLEGIAGYREFHQLRQATSLSGVQAVDDRTLRVSLVRPWPGFVTLTAHPALSPVPPAAAQLSYDAEPIGDGPYRLSQTWGIGQAIRMERYDGYYGTPAKIDRLEFDVYDTAEKGWPDFVAGHLDVSTVPPALLSEARSDYGDAGVVTLARLLYCGFNLKLKPFQDGRLRRAVSLALDRPNLAAGVYGEIAAPAKGIVPPSIRGSDPNACGTNCAHDAGEAARLVAALPAARRIFQLAVIRTDVGEQLANTVVAQLKAVGLTAKPHLLDEGEFGDLLNAGDQQAFCLVWDADTATQQDMLEPLLASGSPDNRSYVHSPRIDAALDTGRTSASSVARRAAYASAERIALDVLPVVPLVWFRSHLAVRRYVQGFRLDPLGMFDVAALDLLPPGSTPAAGPSATP